MSEEQQQPQPQEQQQQQQHQQPQATTLPKFTLYSYWRSSSAWRVRVMLHVKDIPYDYVPVPLLQKKQQSAEFQGFNPMQQVPSLKIEYPDGRTFHINQSLAIINYLESFQTNGVAIYSTDPLERAYEEELALDIVSGIQPIQNLNILLDVKQLAGGDDEKKMAWAKKYITNGLTAIEQKLSQRPFAHGNAIITPFHMSLIPQLYNARRFNCDMDLFPTLIAIEDHCKALPEFIVAEPDNQPDAGKL